MRTLFFERLESRVDRAHPHADRVVEAVKRGVGQGSARGSIAPQKLPTQQDTVQTSHLMRPWTNNSDRIEAYILQTTTVRREDILVFVEDVDEAGREQTRLQRSRFLLVFDELQD